MEWSNNVTDTNKFIVIFEVIISSVLICMQKLNIYICITQINLIFRYSESIIVHCLKWWKIRTKQVMYNPIVIYIKYLKYFPRPGHGLKYHVTNSVSKYSVFLWHLFSYMIVSREESKSRVWFAPDEKLSQASLMTEIAQGHPFKRHFSILSSIYIMCPSWKYQISWTISRKIISIKVNIKRGSKNVFLTLQYIYREL